MKLPRQSESVLQALRDRNFAIYAGGSTFAFIGFWLQKIAVGYLAWELTHSGAWVGAIAFADLFPTVIVSPLAGTLVDHWDRIRALRITQGLAVAQTVVLMFLCATGLVNIWLLLALTLFLGVVYSFNQVLQLTMTPALVPRSSLTSGVALMSVLFNVARFVGPTLAAAVLTFGGAAMTFAVNAAFFAVCFWSLFNIEIVNPDVQRPQRSGILKDLGEGLRYTATHPGIGPVILLLIATSLGCRPVIELLPGFNGAVFELEAGGLGALTAAIGVGAIFGGLWVGGHPNPLGLARITIRHSLVLAGATMVFAFTSNIWLALPVLALLGFSMAATAVSAQTLVQFAVEGAMRGRVLGLFGLIYRGFPAIGALAIGAASEFFGFAWPQFLAALLAVVAWIWSHAHRDRIAKALEPASSKS